jgi:hypothetical protein
MVGVSRSTGKLTSAVVASTLCALWACGTPRAWASPQVEEHSPDAVWYEARAVQAENSWQLRVMGEIYGQEFAHSARLVNGTWVPPLPSMGTLGHPDYLGLLSEPGFLGLLEWTWPDGASVTTVMRLQAHGSIFDIAEGITRALEELADYSDADMKVEISDVKITALDAERESQCSARAKGGINLGYIYLEVEITTTVDGPCDQQQLQQEATAAVNAALAALQQGIMDLIDMMKDALDAVRRHFEPWWQSLINWFSN